MNKEINVEFLSGDFNEQALKAQSGQFSSKYR